jgi:hypothetical protein
MTALPVYERILEREGMRPLDYDDGAGGIKVGNRGSGKLLDGLRAFARASATDRLEARRAVLSRLTDEGQRFKRLGELSSLEEQERWSSEHRVYALYAGGVSVRVIARRTGLDRGQVHRRICWVETRYHDAPQAHVDALVAACDATTLVLVFALLERALAAPGEVRTMLAAARAVPAIRALVEPDEVRDDG